MKKVTDITPQKKNKKRVNLYLDGEFYGGVELVTLLSERIKIGDEIDDERLAEVIERSEYSSALEKSLDYVSRNLRTKMQVIRYLKDKGYQGKTIAKVIDKLLDYGYVNDEAYAKTFAEQKKTSKGKRAIAYELKTKGVDDKTIETVMSEAADEDDGCMRVALRYLKGKTPDYETKVKTYRYLLSKGFDYDVAKKTLDKIMSDEDSIS